MGSGHRCCSPVPKTLQCEATPHRITLPPNHISQDGKHASKDGGDSAVGDEQDEWTEVLRDMNFMSLNINGPEAGGTTKTNTQIGGPPGASKARYWIWAHLLAATCCVLLVACRKWESTPGPTKRVRNPNCQSTSVTPGASPAVHLALSRQGCGVPSPHPPPLHCPPQAPLLPGLPPGGPAARVPALSILQLVRPADGGAPHLAHCVQMAGVYFASGPATRSMPLGLDQGVG